MGARDQQKSDSDVEANMIFNLQASRADIRGCPEEFDSLQTYSRSRPILILCRAFSRNAVWVLSSGVDDQASVYFKLAEYNATLPSCLPLIYHYTASCLNIALARLLSKQKPWVKTMLALSYININALIPSQNISIVSDALY